MAWHFRAWKRRSLTIRTCHKSLGRNDGRPESGPAAIPAGWYSSAPKGNLSLHSLKNHSLFLRSARRIKCDETHPTCKKCAKGGRVCEYKLRWQPIADPELVLERERLAIKVSPVREAEPPDWDFMQSIRYCKLFLQRGRFIETNECRVRNIDLTIVKPQRSNELEAVRDPRFNSGSIVPASFTCLVLANRISNASKSQGKIIPFEDPFFSGIRSQYHHYLAKHLVVINKFMQSTNAADKCAAIHSLYALIALDCSMTGSMWRIHANGALAYVKHLGGIRALHPLPSGISKFRLILWYVPFQIDFCN